MIDLYLPPKPAIIRPAEYRKANFLPGWMPAAVAQKPVEVEFLQVRQSASDSGPYSFWSVPLGEEHPTRHILIALRAIAGSSSITVGGITCTSLVANSWFIVSYPTGSTATVEVTESGLNVHCAIIVYALRRIKSATPLDTYASNFLAAGSKSGTLIVEKGGAIVAVANNQGTGTNTWSFSGGTTTTDLSGNTNDAYSVSSGHGLVAADDAALSFTATRGGSSVNWGLAGISFR